MNTDIAYFNKKDRELLNEFARYVWWETKDYIINNDPLQIVASAMKYANNVASFLRVCDFSDEVLKETLKQAQPGWFDGKSWYFWHYRLYGNDITVPPLPKRGFLK